MSRFDFKRTLKALDKNTAVISINDTDKEKKEMSKLTQDICPALILAFKDDEYGFTKQHAKQIQDFVKANKNKVFVVHCFAGVSRSAAVARWIEDTVDGKNSHRLARYTLYNKHVYNTLMQS